MGATLDCVRVAAIGLCALALLSACNGARARADVVDPASPSVAIATPLPTPLSTSTTAPARPAAGAAAPSATPAPAAPGAPEPVGTVSFYESTVTIPTYPVAAFQSDARSPVYDWPYRRTDMAAFAEASVTPEARTYKTLVLENKYLLITILPELGGRILQVEHKPTGTRMFYNNSVVKPTAWGPHEQSGWLALGGLEWDLPVEEHGYAWGEAWGYIPLEFSPDRAAITVFTPQDGRALSASVTIELLAGAASFTVEPTISNVSDASQRFDFWHNAMLAPGSGAGISPGIHFVLPTESMMVHSTADVRLPAGGQQVTWPKYMGRDLSRLKTWTNYAGLFEAPAAHGPFVAVYDTQQDAGAVRVFPAAVAQGSKIFALGGTSALDPTLYTDDGSAYVELHGGLAPTFAQQTELPPGNSVTWRESWYPVAGLGDLSTANEMAALYAAADADTVRVDIFAVHPMDVEVLLLDGGGTTLERTATTLSPAGATHLEWARTTLDTAPASVRVESAQGLVLAYDFPISP